MKRTKKIIDKELELIKLFRKLLSKYFFSTSSSFYNIE